MLCYQQTLSCTNGVNNQHINRLTEHVIIRHTNCNRLILY